MYTILWLENGLDRWDRFESQEEIKNKLKEIEKHPDTCPLGDIWIFPPTADTLAFTGEDFLNTEEEDTPILITKNQAMEIAQLACELKGYGILASTGYFQIFKNKEQEVTIDINKEKDTTNREYFAVYISFSHGDSKYSYTESLNKDELCRLILEIAQDCANTDVN